MTYEIIQPPFTLNFRTMSKRELEGYYEWFKQMIPERICMLEKTVRESESSWTADRSPKSLSALGQWFVGEVETRPRTSEEMEELRSKLPDSIDISSVELTNRTFSLAMDIGMYLGEVFRKKVCGAEWTLHLKKNVNFGQPVLTGFKVPLNPVRVALTGAYRAARGSRWGNHLLSVYKGWLSDMKT